MIPDDLQQIAKDYNYCIEPISRIISKKAINSVYTTIQRLERLRRKLGKVPFTTLKYSRNKIRKSKSHFRK